jgi:hypothetical protein
MGQEPSYYRNDCLDLPGILTVDRGHRPASAGIIAFAPPAGENARGCSKLMPGKSFAHVGAGALTCPSMEPEWSAGSVVYVRIVIPKIERLARIFG